MELRLNPSFPNRPSQLSLNFKQFPRINNYPHHITKFYDKPGWYFSLKSQINPVCSNKDSILKCFSANCEMGIAGKSEKFQPCGNWKLGLIKNSHQGTKNWFIKSKINPICCRKDRIFKCFSANCEMGSVDNVAKIEHFGDWDVELMIKRGLAMAVLVYSAIRCRRVLAVEGVMVGGNVVGVEQMGALVRNAWPVLLKVLCVFKEHGLVLTALLGLSAFFSMAETSITTLWPWKVRELAEKDSEDGVFKMLRNDVTRFLTTILIGTTVVNIAATALVTEAATNLFGEAGVSAATGVMTVAILLLTEITPKSIAVHHATEVARFVVRPVAWLSLILYPVGRVVTFLSGKMLKLIGLKAASEPNVTEEELKLMLRVAELSGAIEEEEQDMIENVLEIKDTHVREVMTPLVDVVAIDARATLIDFHNLWVLHQYSRVPVFEQRIDNIVGIAYAMELLDSLQKQDQLDDSVVGDVAQPAYFVPDSMSVWNLLREFRIRKVHMAVVLNEYGGTIGVVTMEDVVEEIVGEIFDENDSKEEIQRKTGYIVMRADGVFDVDASTSIDQLCEDLDIVLPEGHQYETVSGFLCEAFGCIPRAGESLKVVLEKAKREESNGYTHEDSHPDEEKYQIYRLEILAANARKVSSVRFKRLKQGDLEAMTPEVTRLVPKIMKKRLRVSEDSSNNSDEKLLLQIDYVATEPEIQHANACMQ